MMLRCLGVLALVLALATTLPGANGLPQAPLLRNDAADGGVNLGEVTQVRSIWTEKGYLSL